MDNLTPEQRKRSMKAIKSTETQIEIKLRKALWEKGYRYRKNYKGLIGKPDIVFVSKKIAIFCDSEFWHGYDWENRKTRIKTNREYWLAKIERNIERDKEVSAELERLSWTVLRLWGKEIEKNLDECIKKIEEAISSI
jgi:DNA mismatch endonuclease Vsr